MQLVEEIGHKGLEEGDSQRSEGVRALGFSVAHRRSSDSGIAAWTLVLLVQSTGATHSASIRGLTSIWLGARLKVADER